MTKCNSENFFTYTTLAKCTCKVLFQSAAEVGNPIVMSKITSKLNFGANLENLICGSRQNGKMCSTISRYLLKLSMTSILLPKINDLNLSHRYPQKSEIN